MRANNYSTHAVFLTGQIEYWKEKNELFNTVFFSCRIQLRDNMDLC